MATINALTASSVTTHVMAPKPNPQNDATLKIRIRDSGGAGLPRAVIFIPISKEGAGWKVSLDHVPPPVGGLGLKDVAYLFPLTGAQARANDADSVRSQWTALHPKVPWPFDTPLVLVMLLYRQPRGVGNNQVQTVEGLNQTASVIDVEDWPDVTTAVTYRLNQLSALDVTKSCIIGPLEAP